MDKRKRDLLDYADWESIIPRLVKYALNKLGRRSLYKSSPVSGTETAQLAQDHVMEAIGKLWTEKISWDYGAKDLLTLLKGGIDSQISHIFDDDEYLTTERFPTGHLDKETEGIEVEEMLKKANPHEKHAREMTPSVSPDPETTLLDKERQEQDNAATDILLERLRGDKELEDVVLCIMAGITKPREIAKEMGIETKHVNNLQKKLRRIYKDLHEQARKEKRQ